MESLTRVFRASHPPRQKTPVRLGDFWGTGTGAATHVLIKIYNLVLMINCNRKATLYFRNNFPANSEILHTII